MGENITFKGSFTDPGIKDTHTIIWDFGDGTTTTGSLQPTHTYAVDGNYTVTLTVTDNNGEATSVTTAVTVKKLPTLSINDITLVEGDDGTKLAVFTASLSQVSTRTITLNYF